MRELINAFGLLSINQFVSVIFGFVRTKILSTMVGTFGVGIVSQATYLMQLLRQISTLGISGGFVKLIAEYRSKEDQAQLNKTIITALSVFSIFGIFIVILSWFFGKQIAIWIFGNPTYEQYILIVSIAAYLAVEYRLVLSIFRGLLQWREYVFVSVVGYSLNVISTFILIFFHGIFGAMLSILVAQAINLLLSLYFLRRKVILSLKLAPWRHKPDVQSFRNLLRFVGPLSTVTLLALLATLYIRSEIIHTPELGADSNGIYHVAAAMSTAYMGLLIFSLSTFGEPRVTTLLKNPKAIIQLQNDEMKLGVLVIAPIILALMAFRNIWIPILFSRDFLAAGTLLIWQFGGDFFRVISTTLNITLLPMERFTFIYFNGLLYWGGWAYLSKYLIPHFGLSAIPISYLIVNLVMLVSSFFYHTLTTQYRVSRGNAILLIKAITLTTLGLIFSHVIENAVLQMMISSIILIIMLIWLPTRKDYSDLANLIRERIIDLSNQDSQENDQN
ncbi:MAG: oligosaccharide flippase family protein [Chloroflexi bacterium]|nr:oligosaccharide flippase family protein [Chloroflexota bacterium]